MASKAVPLVDQASSWVKVYFEPDYQRLDCQGPKEGMNEADPTIAGLLKDQGYATGQFGKNHLGDRDEHLPTNHGFDEFFVICTT